jgi:hypothetical protein
MMRNGLRRKRGRQGEVGPEALLKRKPIFHGVALMDLGRSRLAPSTDYLEQVPTHEMREIRFPWKQGGAVVTNKKFVINFQTC